MEILAFKFIKFFYALALLWLMQSCCNFGQTSWRKGEKYHVMHNNISHMLSKASYQHYHVAFHSVISYSIITIILNCFCTVSYLIKLYCIIHYCVLMLYRTVLCHTSLHCVASICVMQYNSVFCCKHLSLVEHLHLSTHGDASAVLS